MSGIFRYIFYSVCVCECEREREKGEKVLGVIRGLE